MLLYLAISALFKQFYAIVESALLVQGLKYFPKLIDPQLVLEPEHSILLLFPRGHQAP